MTITSYFEGCKEKYLVGDGYCNSETNNLHCDFDRGDCCYSKLLVNDFCAQDLNTQCQCLTGALIDDDSQPIIGDGYCNDIANIHTYDYDGGDCCGTCVVKYCSNSSLNCTCKDDSFEEGVTNPLLGDGICNDNTNNDECMFDLGREYWRTWNGNS